MNTKRSVIITGASSGIGLSTVKKFHEMGYFIFMLARNREKLNQITAELKNTAGIFCDLSDYKSIDQAVNVILNEHPQSDSINCLVNNAGIFHRNSFEKTNILEWEHMFKVNLHGPAYLSQKIIPLLKKQKRSSICMVSSTLGLKTSANTSAYSASKAAMINFAQSLALELAPDHVRCNVVAPGIVETPIHGFEKMDKNKKEETLNFYNTLQPLARVGQPDDIAQTIYFLCSEASSWTTGAVVSVDGGINLL